GVEKVSSTPMNGRSWSRNAMSEISCAEAGEVMAGADNPAPTPSAAAPPRKLRRPITWFFWDLNVGFMSVCSDASVSHHDEGSRQRPHPPTGGGAYSHRSTPGRENFFSVTTEFEVWGVPISGPRL